MQAMKYVLSLVVIGVGAYWVLPDRSRAQSADADPNVVYLCRETKALIKAPPQPVPALNPKTGRKTLYRALYCAECKNWQPVPPPDMYSGNPLTYHCPKHRRQMTASGPRK